jgi:hypothetical protein
MEMYKVNGEQCKKCGKLFHKEDKVVKMVDADGNELHIDLCNKCELETMIEEVMESKHISYEEASKYVVKQINDLIDKAMNVEVYNNREQYFNVWNNNPRVWNRPFTEERLDKIVRMVKDNE